MNFAHTGKISCGNHPVGAILKGEADLCLKLKKDKVLNQGECMAEQCRGTTRSGERCKNTRTTIDGYCHLHTIRKSEPDVKVPDATGSGNKSSMSTDTESTNVAGTRKSFWLLSGILFVAVLLVAGVIQTITGQPAAMKGRSKWRF